MKKIIILLLGFFLLLSGCSSDIVIIEEIDSIDTGIDSNGWILIPAGEFLKGQHEHSTLIDYDYEVMVTDVTNEQFAGFLTEALSAGVVKIDSNIAFGYYKGEAFDNYNHEIEFKPGDRVFMDFNASGIRITYTEDQFRVVKGYENHPVIQVTWFGANAFAEFYHYRLPTENEWEKAARGKDNRVFPWGNEITRHQANYYSSQHLFEKMFSKQTFTTPVGFYNGKTYDGFKTEDGKSYYGLYDMAGNVWQWTLDDYHLTHLRYLRGGSQANYEYNLRVWARNSAGPEHSGINIGFRCVRGIHKITDKPDAH